MKHNLLVFSGNLYKVHSRRVQLQYNSCRHSCSWTCCSLLLIRARSSRGLHLFNCWWWLQTITNILTNPLWAGRYPRMHVSVTGCAMKRTMSYENPFAAQPCHHIGLRCYAIWYANKIRKRNARARIAEIRRSEKLSSLVGFSCCSALRHVATCVEDASVWPVFSQDLSVASGCM